MAKDKSSLAERLAVDLAALAKKNAKSIQLHEWLIGIDEVGWGCIAGDLVLGAVAIKKSLLETWPTSEPFNLIRDSKQLTASTRERIKLAVEQRDWGQELRVVYGLASVAHINKYGLASAYDECLRQIINDLPVWVRSYLIFLDGKRIPKFLSPYPTTLQIKGDDASLAIGLASVMAKEKRDAIMTDLHRLYPAYNFQKNKGYGTVEHVQALRTQGISPCHRTKGTATILQD